MVKIGGVAADVAEQRLREWFVERKSVSLTLWSSEQWPAIIRENTDIFAEQLCVRSQEPPVVYFCEWVDLWSSGDLIRRVLGAPGEQNRFVIHGNRFELFTYSLPDSGRLLQHLSDTGPQQFQESDWFVARLREAIDAWHKIVERALIIVLRQAFDTSALDRDIEVSLRTVPFWLSNGDGKLDDL